MSAFNNVLTQSCCPFCNHNQKWSVQFKYGDCWQFDYKIGDVLRWGGNDYGENVGGNVRTEGIASESCESCGKDFIYAAVYFRDNRITKIELLREPLELQMDYEVLP